MLQKWGVCISCRMGGLCCGNVGYVSVAEMGVCVVYRNGRYVSVAEMGGMYQLQNGGYVLWKCWVCISCRNRGIYVLEKWGVCISCRNGGMCCGNVGYVSVAEMGGMCCRNVGYVSVAEMGVCVAEMWGMYQLQKCCRNGGMYQLQKWGYVLWKCGVCVSCRNGGMCCRNRRYVYISCRNGWSHGSHILVAAMGICIAEMWGMCCRSGGMYQLQNSGVCVAEMGGTTTSSRYVSGEVIYVMECVMSCDHQVM